MRLKEPSQKFMIKVIVSFGVLLIINLTILFIAKVRLEPFEKVMFYSKTRGLDKTVYDGSKDVFKFERLVPHDLTQISLDFNKRTYNYSYQYEYPFSDLYLSAINYKGEDTFNNTAKVVVEYSLKEEGVSEFIEKYKEEYVNNIDGFFAEVEKKIDTVITSNISTRLELKNIREFDKAVFEEKVRGDLETAMPYILYSNIELKELYIADYNLYEKAQEIYMDNVDSIALSKHLFDSKNTYNKAEQEAKLKILGEYGKVFTTYPILLEYMKVSSLEKDPLGLYTNNFTYEALDKVNAIGEVLTANPILLDYMKEMEVGNDPLNLYDYFEIEQIPSFEIEDLVREETRKERTN